MLKSSQLSNENASVIRSRRLFSTWKGEPKGKCDPENGCEKVPLPHQLNYRMGKTWE